MVFIVVIILFWVYPRLSPLFNKTDVKNIDQQYRGKNRKELII